MVETTAPATVICIWCNRVMDWGRVRIWYDVCEGCLPGVAAVIERSRRPQPHRRPRHVLLKRAVRRVASRSVRLAPRP